MDLGGPGVDRESDFWRREYVGETEKEVTLSDCIPGSEAARERHCERRCRCRC